MVASQQTQNIALQMNEFLSGPHRFRVVQRLEGKLHNGVHIPAASAIESVQVITSMYYYDAERNRLTQVIAQRWAVLEAQ